MEYTTIRLKIYPEETEYEIDLPMNSTFGEIIRELIDQKIIPAKRPNGNPFEYRLLNYQNNNETKDEHTTLMELGTKDWALFKLIPVDEPY